jgi:putative addiction module component (TIGR02574 family)
MVSMKEIRQLSVEERILMVEAIWDSIEEDTLKPEALTHEQQQELIRRIELHESGKGKSFTWEEVKNRLKEG